MLKQGVAFATGGWTLLALSGWFEQYQPVVMAVGTLLCAAGLLALAGRTPR